MRSIILILVLALSGCSFRYPMNAIFSNGRLAFDARKHSSGCIYYFEITDSSGRTMWRVEGGYKIPPCRSSIPVVYGVIPYGTKQTAPLHRLRFGERYYISASDGDGYYGSFQLRKVIAVDNDSDAGISPPQMNQSLDELTQPVKNSR